MVYEDEADGFNRLIRRLLEKIPPALSNEDATLEQHRDQTETWHLEFLGEARRHRTELQHSIFNVARHIAQRGSAPTFFPFEARDDHDLDLIARDILGRRLDLLAADEMVRSEYARVDRFWRTLFHQYDHFKEFVDQRVRYVIGQQRGQGPIRIDPTSGHQPGNGEVDQLVKDEVKSRDRGQCLACGATKTLQVDHILSLYRGGSNEASNLQTLCKRCNQRKGIITMRFTVHRTPLSAAPPVLPEFPTPEAEDAASAEHWSRFLRATLNFFYQCSAVNEIAIAGKGEGYYNWQVSLMSDNHIDWLRPLLPTLLSRIQGLRQQGHKPRIRSITLSAPSQANLQVVQPVILAATNPFQKTKGDQSHPVFEFMRKSKTPVEDDDAVNKLVTDFLDKRWEANASQRNKFLQDIRKEFLATGALSYGTPRVL